tara:strand:+ start:532 stop:717 length:186 start_codon:yes stop_codon:yes gene_type:complete
MNQYIIYKAKWTWDIEDGVEKILDTVRAKNEKDAVKIFENKIKWRVFNPFIHRVAEIKVII